MQAYVKISILQETNIHFIDINAPLYIESPPSTFREKQTHSPNALISYPQNTLLDLQEYTDFTILEDTTADVYSAARRRNRILIFEDLEAQNRNRNLSTVSKSYKKGDKVVLKPGSNVRFNASSSIMMADQGELKKGGELTETFWKNLKASNSIGNAIRINYTNRSNINMELVSIKTDGKSLKKYTVVTGATLKEDTLAVTPWIIQKKTTSSKIGAYIPDQMFPVGKNVYFATEANFDTIFEKKVIAYQPLERKSTENVTSGLVKTYDRYTKLLFLAYCEVEFLHHTVVFVDTPNGQNRFAKTFLSNSKLGFDAQTYLTLNDPPNVLLKFNTNSQMQIIIPTKHVVAQTDVTKNLSKFISCNPKCKKCHGPNETDCTECYANYFLLAGSCECPKKGFYEVFNYLKDDSMMSGFRVEVLCGRCSDACISCNGPTSNDCLQCKPEYFVLNLFDPHKDKTNLYCLREASKCHEYSHFGVALTTGRICYPCHSSCLECNSDGPKACTKCRLDTLNMANTRYYLKNECYPACPIGYTYTAGENNCMACLPNVATCAVGDPNEIITCVTSLFLNIRTETKYGAQEKVTVKECIPTCPTGMYGENIDNTCKPCDPKCAACVKEPSYCTECEWKQGGNVDRWFHVTDSMQCVEKCELGYTTNINKNTGVNLCEPIKCEIDYCEKNGCHYVENFCDKCKPEIYDIDNDWIKPVQRDLGTGICVTCDSVGGLYKGSDDRCWNICGNGYLYDLGGYDDMTCDDNNLIDGDGCSSTCQIEENFKCRRGDLNTDFRELNKKQNADICNKTPVWALKEENGVTELPTIFLNFDMDVCFEIAFFQEIYRPYCAKKDSVTGKRVEILHFEIFTTKECREFRIEFKLQNDYAGALSFYRNDGDPPSRILEDVDETRVLQTRGDLANRPQIYDENDNVVDFTSIYAEIAYSQAEMQARERLAQTAKKMEKLQAVLAGPIFLAMLALQPLADFNANVLQRIVFLQLLDISYPSKVQMYLTLFGGLGSSGTAVNMEEPDYTGKNNKPKGIDAVLGITPKDQMGPKKFRDKKINKLFVKTGFTNFFQIVVNYLICVMIMKLARKFKTYYNSNPYVQENEAQGTRRKLLYTLFKGLKQALIWKNVLIGLITSFQALALTTMLNIFYGEMTKPVLVISVILSYFSIAIMFIMIGLIGYNLYIMTPDKWPDQKSFERHVRKYYKGIIKPFLETTNARY